MSGVSENKPPASRTAPPLFGGRWGRLWHSNWTNWLPMGAERAAAGGGRRGGVATAAWRGWSCNVAHLIRIHGCEIMT